MHQVDIAIVGAGMVGLTLARALKDSGLSIAVISHQPAKSEIPDTPLLRVSAIHAANQTALQNLGAWPLMPQERLSAYTAMQVWDTDSFGKISFDCKEMQAPELGHIIENQLIVNALVDVVDSQENATILAPVKIDKVLTGKQETMLMLSNDEVVSCRLLVGADGAQSMIRKQASFPHSFKDYDHTAIVATVHTELPHNQVARQAFTPTGPLALLPLADPHLCSIVFSQQSLVANDLMHADDDAFCQALMVASNGELGKISLESERQSFPLTMRYARQWVKDGIVIIGDAAHTIHPLAGQGANLGMQDALALAELILDVHAQDKPFYLHRYLRPFERARKTEALKMIAAMEGFKQLFDGSNPLKKFIRGAGLTAVDNLPVVKQHFISQAMGW